MKNDYRIDGQDVILTHRRKDGTTSETSMSLCDFEIANRIPGYWSIQNNRYGNGYVTTVINRKKNYLHQHILGPTKPGHEVDHKDGDSLNNRHGNLQALTVQQNRAKMKLSHGARNQTGLPRNVYKQSSKQSSGNYFVVVSGQYLGTFKDLAVAEERATNYRALVNWQRLILPMLEPEHKKATMLKAIDGFHQIAGSMLRSVKETMSNACMGVA